MILWIVGRYQTLDITIYKSGRTAGQVSLDLKSTRRRVIPYPCTSRIAGSGRKPEYVNPAGDADIPGSKDEAMPGNHPPLSGWADTPLGSSTLLSLAKGGLEWTV